MRIPFTQFALAKRTLPLHSAFHFNAKLEMAEPNKPEEVRIENDSMGPMKIPVNAYWGAQTQRYSSTLL
jgi:hypothetical protein